VEHKKEETREALNESSDGLTIREEAEQGVEINAESSSHESEAVVSTPSIIGSTPTSTHEDFSKKLVSSRFKLNNYIKKKKKERKKNQVENDSFIPIS
jgi:hypothetical protein